jgi:hypothetical protein
MVPIVHGLEAEFGEQMNFIYLDIDDPENQENKRLLKYRYQPHFILIDKMGNVIQQWVGFVSENELRLGIEKALSN